MAQDISASSSRSARIRHEELGYDARPTPTIRSDRNLLAAIMGRAILDLYGEAVTSRLTMASARAWLYDPIEEDKIFSFGWVAKQLDLDPIVVREHLIDCSYDKEKLVKCLSFLR